MSDSQIEFEEKEPAILILVKSDGTNGGRPFYAYLAVQVDKLADFSAIVHSGVGFNIEDYGVIIEAGIGEPGEEVQRRMTEEYGFDHENGVVVK